MMFNIFKSKKERTIEKLIKHWQKIFSTLQEYNAHKEFEACIKTELYMHKAMHDIYNPGFSSLYDDTFTNSESYNLWLIRFNSILFQSIILKSCLASKIESYLPVLLRKRAMLTIKDDYGDYNSDKWLKELHNFYKEKLTDNLYKWLNENITLTKLDFNFDMLYFLDDPDMSMTYIIDEYLNYYDYESECNYFKDMSGLEYEQFICNMFRNEGFNSSVTKATGDHGVDIISEYNSFKIAIQCKHYNSKVSNKAVQEIYTAKNIFDCDIAIVVTNNEFTPAAKEAAKKLDVYLLHHDDIPLFCDEIRSMTLSNN